MTEVEIKSAKKVTNVAQLDVSQNIPKQTIVRTTTSEVTGVPSTNKLSGFRNGFVTGNGHVLTEVDIQTAMPLISTDEEKPTNSVLKQSKLVAVGGSGGHHMDNGFFHES